MVLDPLERRLDHRFPLQLSIEVSSQGSSQVVAGMTRDLSARGIYFYVSHDIEQSPIELVLTFPPEITWAGTVRIRCHGRIVRLESNTPHGTGVGAFIEDYAFLPQT